MSAKSISPATCAHCSRVVPAGSSWLDSEEWHMSRHCPTCLFGPLPEPSPGLLLLAADTAARATALGCREEIAAVAATLVDQVPAPQRADAWAWLADAVDRDEHLWGADLEDATRRLTGHLIAFRIITG